jgi:putative sterol carrier protein
MVDRTADFFEQVNRRGHEPVLARTSGRIRFEIASDGRTEHWLVRVDRGALSVSQGDEAADCVVRANRDIFDDVVTGRQNAFAAVLRGVIVLEGDMGLLAQFQHLFPAGARRPLAASARTVGRQRS